MRTRLMIVLAALLASATLAMAQTPPPAAPAPAAPSLGSIDFGGRFFSTTGDEARAERYRDLRDGLYSKLVFAQDKESYLFAAEADNIGYHDQRYAVNYKRSRMKFSFLWDSTPLNYSYMTMTPFVETSKGVWTLPAATRSAVQGPGNSTTDGVVGVPCAPGGPPAACGNPAQAAQALANRSVYNNLATGFDLQQRRDTAGFNMTAAATTELALNVAFTTTAKTGYQPWGASFAFNNANEVPLPLDNRTNDFSLSAEWANEQGMVRAAWDGSWFGNNIDSLTWDNPIRATDFTNGLAPPLGPWDPSAYTNGNGPAMGRMAVAPDNSMQVYSFTGLYKLPAHSTINGIVSLSDNKQNDTLIPWTTNQVILNADPFFKTLERGTAEAEVRSYNALLNFNTRPTSKLAFSARYRYNKHDNRTPEFDAIEYVRFDGVPEETGGISEGFDITRDTLDLNATLSLVASTALRIGYSLDTFNRTGRSFADMADRTFRVSVDTFSNQYLTFRGTYEKTERLGSGFSEDAIEEGGAQPDLRFYDEADRNRDRATLLLIVTPVDKMDFSASYSYGKDVYKGEGHEFGLKDAKTTAYNVGLNAYPSDTMTLGMNYGREQFDSFQESRNANPSCLLSVPPCLPGAYDTWTDPTRTWNLDNVETVNNFNLFVDLIKAIKKTDIRAPRNDFSDSDNNLDLGGPRVQALATNTAGDSRDGKPCGTQPVTSCFEQLVPVTNQWQRFTFDLKYFVTERVGIGLGWWYEKFDVNDFSTIDSNGSVAYVGATGTPRIDYLGGLMLGYGNRPYKSNTGFLRLIALF